MEHLQNQNKVMKELSIEEKAKRYDEAIERAKEKYAMFEGMKQGDVLEDVFPELKESEDKKPNGAIVMEDFNEGNGFYKVNLAYLNKGQVEDIENIIKRWNAQKYDKEAIRDCIGVILTDAPEQRFVDFNTSLKDCLAWLEKQGNLMKALQISNARIGELIEKNYYLREQLENQGENTYNKVLSELLHKVICRFINDPDIPYFDREKVSMEVLPYVERLEKQGEQNLIMAKLPQLGEQKSAWSKEDEKMYTATILALAGFMCNEDKIDWLKSLKDRVQPKQEWSEEEEENFKKAIRVLKVNNFHHTADMLQEMKYKLIPREKANWKPSDEQMKTLQEVIDVWYFTSYPNSLETLYEQLKKLKGE